MSGTSTQPDPLFVGGTGRSGTHALARVLGCHSSFQSIPFEVKFHSDPPGLPGLMNGKVSLEKFLAELRGYWWRREHPDGGMRGLCLEVTVETFEPAVEAFERDFKADPDTASGKLLRTLLDPIAAATGKSTWIENTNRNIAAGPMLLKMLPGAKFIHILRDGRDTAASLVKQHFGPDDLDKALDWWERRLAKTERGAQELPQDRLLAISFEDLVINDREATYARLLEFLGAQESPEMRKRFDKKTGPRKANIGRWQQELSRRRQRKFTKRYAQALERLIAFDTPARPLLERALTEL
jgi:sulfotransferase family protein